MGRGNSREGGAPLLFRALLALARLRGVRAGKPRRLLRRLRARFHLCERTCVRLRRLRVALCRHPEV
jgi:hypothetical protein